MLWGFTVVFPAVLVLELSLWYKKQRQIKKLESAGFTLKNNFFEFNTKIIQQISGTAIRTKIDRPTHLWLWVGWKTFLELEVVEPWLWLRYIDRTFFVWTGSEYKLEDFLNRLNNFNPKLKPSYEKSKSFANFLYGSVSMVDNKLETDIYCKPCARHQFLQFNYAHPFYK